MNPPTKMQKIKAAPIAPSQIFLSWSLMWMSRLRRVTAIAIDLLVGCFVYNVVDYEVLEEVRVSDLADHSTMLTWYSI